MQMKKLYVLVIITTNLKEIDLYNNGVRRWHMQFESILSRHRYSNLQHWKPNTIKDYYMYIHTYMHTHTNSHRLYSVVYKYGPDASLSTLGRNCFRVAERDGLSSHRLSTINTCNLQQRKANTWKQSFPQIH